MRRPMDGEYGSYYKPYVNLTRGTSIIQNLDDSFHDTLNTLGGLNDNQAEYAYADGKWNIKELLLHLIDTERVFAYRALSIARGDKTKLPGYDHNNYVTNSEATSRNFSSLIEEYSVVRQATIELFKNMSETMLNEIGNANGFKTSALATGFIISGHNLHHLNIIKERYLPHV